MDPIPNPPSPISIRHLTCRGNSSWEEGVIGLLLVDFLFYIFCFVKFSQNNLLVLLMRSSIMTSLVLIKGAWIKFFLKKWTIPRATNGLTKNQTFDLTPYWVGLVGSSWHVLFAWVGSVGPIFDFGKSRCRPKRDEKNSGRIYDF